MGEPADGVGGDGGAEARRSRVAAAVRPAWMGREISIIWWARVAMSASRALAGVITPLYLAAIGFDALRLGVLMVAVAATSAVLSAVIGLASDRLGRKPFLVLLPLASALAGVAFAFSSSVGILFVAAAIGSFGRGAGAGAGAVGPYQPAESALVTDLASPTTRSRAFGRLAFGSSLGALAGGLLATLAGGGHPLARAALATYRPAFLATAALSLVAGLVALAIREPRRPPARTGAPRRPRLPHRSFPLLWRLWVTNSFNGLAVGMFGPFVTYWFYLRYGASAAEIGVLYAVINAATLVSTLSAAGLAERFGLVRTVVAVRTAQALLLVPMVLAPSFLLAGGLYLVRMVVQRIGLPLRQSYVLAMADPDERASVTALSNLPSQVAMAGSPVAAGYLFDEVSLSLPFEIASLLQLANTVTFWWFFRHAAPDEEREGRRGTGSAARAPAWARARAAAEPDGPGVVRPVASAPRPTGASTDIVGVRMAAGVPGAPAPQSPGAPRAARP